MPALIQSRRTPSLLQSGYALPSRPKNLTWIRTGKTGHRAHPRLQPILGFLEKPSKRAAQHHYESGCVWNTMIMVGKASRFWKLGIRFMPRVMSPLERFRRFLEAFDGNRLDPHQEAVTLDHIYRSIRPCNFSAKVLSRAENECLALPLDGVEWSDWGRPERILESLSGLG